MSSFKDWLIAISITLLSIILTGGGVLFLSDQTKAMDERIKERAVVKEDMAEEVKKHSPITKDEFMTIHDDLIRLNSKVDSVMGEIQDLKQTKVSHAEPK